MLVQFLHLLVSRHASTLNAFRDALHGDIGDHPRLRSVQSAKGVLHRALKALEPCVTQIRTRYVESDDRRTPVNFLKVYVPPPGEAKRARRVVPPRDSFVRSVEGARRSRVQKEGGLF